MDISRLGLSNMVFSSEDFERRRQLTVMTKYTKYVEYNSSFNLKLFEDPKITFGV